MHEIKVSLKMLVEHADPIFNLKTFISNVNQLNKFFVHSNHKLIDYYDWVGRNEQLTIIKPIKITIVISPNLRISIKENIF